MENYTKVYDGATEVTRTYIPLEPDDEITNKEIRDFWHEEINQNRITNFLLMLIVAFLFAILFKVS